jgi:hypothetical protein
MANFALWARACEPLFWPAGTFACTYAANRRAAIESIIEADPLATCVRRITSEKGSWTGSASDLLRLCAESAREDTTVSPPWAKNPRALAGRLRRAQTFLRSIVTFSREGRTGSRMIRVSTRAEDCVSSVSLVSTAGGNGSRGDQAMVEG